MVMFLEKSLVAIITFPILFYASFLYDANMMFDFLLLAVVSIFARDGASQFINPPPSLTAPGIFPNVTLRKFQNKTVLVDGETTVVRWNTDLLNSTIRLWQQLLDSSSPSSSRRIFGE